jgi:hypothetical protein
MADGRSLTTISDADYDAIECAVMETERGRWFLKEYSRRNRTADTRILLDAIGRLEQAVAGERVGQDLERLRANLKDMASAIVRTKTEIASIHAVEQEHTRLFAASEALDAITRTTELATSDILAAAEHIQEAAWTLREEGANPEVCDDLDRRATEIYTACSFQDITAQRIAKIIQTLRYLEARINAMISTPDSTAVADGPDPFDPGDPSDDLAALDLTQSDIDSVIVDDEIFGTDGQEEVDEEDAVDAEEADFTEAPPIVALPAPAPADEPLDPGAFADIDRMPTREKLRLFT